MLCVVLLTCSTYVLLFIVFHVSVILYLISFVSIALCYYVPSICSILQNNYETIAIVTCEAYRPMCTNSHICWFPLTSNVSCTISCSSMLFSIELNKYRSKQDRFEQICIPISSDMLWMSLRRSSNVLISLSIWWWGLMRRLQSSNNSTPFAT